MSLAGRHRRTRATLRLTGLVTCALLAGAALGVASCGGEDDAEIITPRRNKGGNGGQAGGGSSGGAGAAGALAGAAGSAGLGAGGLGTAGASGNGGASGSAGSAAVGGAAGASGGAGATGLGGAAAGSAGASGNGGASGLAGAAGSAGLAGSGGGGPSEQACVDGLDDDGDGQTDCADIDCKGKATCLPPVPTDWTGPLTAVKKPASIDPAPCGNGSPSTRRFLTPGASVHCSSCTCGERSGASCKLGTVEVKSGATPDNPCTGAQLIDPGAGNCGEFTSNTETGLGVRATLAEEKGTCPPSGGIVDNRPALFEDALDTCTLPGSGTGCNGNLCVPITDAVSTCIIKKDTEAACPAGWPNRSVVYEGGDDQRDCEPCTCGDPASVCSVGKLALNKTPACTPDNAIPKATVDVNGSCRYVSSTSTLPEKWHFALEGLAVTSTTRTVGGGTPKGKVEPQGGSVMCCL